LEVPVLFEITMLLKLDPDANFIASDKDGAAIGLEQVVSDTIYDIDDVEMIEIEVKEK
jgi:sulfur transfer complex TusBCD TusB component (DsrH family)|tara:strand:+ start:2389 stop:2562 length:174 start_codon:yes stop_codon:yes gene_type:complete